MCDGCFFTQRPAPENKEVETMRTESTTTGQGKQGAGRRAAGGHSTSVTSLDGRQTPRFAAASTTHHP
eukprot:scaffold771_cov177-Alexandrium_tamarense.AAC.19